MSNIRAYIQWDRDHGANVEDRLNEVYYIDSDSMIKALSMMFDEGIDSNSTDDEFEEATILHHEFLMSLEPNSEPYMTNYEYWDMTM